MNAFRCRRRGTGCLDSTVPRVAGVAGTGYLDSTVPRVSKRVPFGVVGMAQVI